MGLKGKIRDMFGRSLKRELADPATRQQTVIERLKQAQHAIETEPDQLDETTQSLAELLETWKDVGGDETDFLRLAAVHVPGEPSFRARLLRALFRQSHIAREDLRYLEEEVRDNPRHFAVWVRLNEEARNLEGDDYQRLVRDSYVLGVAPFFPPHKDSTWYDVETEEQARSWFFNALDEALEDALATNDNSPESVELIRIGAGWFPKRTELAMKLATHERANGSVSVETLGILLRALVESPDDKDLRRLAGLILIGRSGHEEEGFELLLQVREHFPGDVKISAALTSALLKLNRIDPLTLPILEERLEQDPDDRDAVVLMARWLGGKDDLSPAALEYYDKAAAHLGEESDLRRIHALALTKQKEYGRAVPLLRALHATDSEDEAITEALAIALVSTHVDDHETHQLVMRVIDSGSRAVELHDAACRWVYRERGADSEETRKRITASGTVVPGLMWPALLKARTQLAAEQHEPAAESLKPLLARRPIEPEILNVLADLVAADTRRQTVRLVLSLPPADALQVFERAGKAAPDSLLILSNLARYRMQQGLLDEETGDILAAICRRDPENMEARVSRAEVLHATGHHETAIEISRELIARNRATASALGATPKAVASIDRRKLIELFAPAVLEAEEPNPTDVALLFEALLDPDLSIDFMLEMTRKLSEAGVSHNLRLPLLERALSLDPENESFDLEVNILRARRGSPRSGLQLALRRLEALDYGPDTQRLFDAVASTLKPEHLNPDVIGKLVATINRRGFVPEPIMVDVGGILAKGVDLPPEARSVLERAAALDAAPPDIRQALDRMGKPSQ